MTRKSWLLGLTMAGAMLASAVVAQPVHDATQWFADGLDHLQSRQPERAIKDFQAGLQLEPQNATGYFYLGEAYLAAGRNSEAIDAYRKALSLDPQAKTADRAKARLSTLEAPPPGPHLPPMIARLGMNTLPERPRLVRPEPVTIPASFCSEAERNDFHEQRYAPLNRQALENNETAKHYLDQLNELHAEYNQLDSGYANVVTREFKDFEPTMQAVHADSDAYYRLHDAIMRTPITPCGPR